MLALQMRRGADCRRVEQACPSEAAVDAARLPLMRVIGVTIAMLLNEAQAKAVPLPLLPLLTGPAKGLNLSR